MGHRANSKSKSRFVKSWIGIDTEAVQLRLLDATFNANYASAAVSGTARHQGIVGRT